jgi:hypothetical protein
MEVSGYSSVIDLRTVRPHLGIRNERWYRQSVEGPALFAAVSLRPSVIHGGD